MWVRPKIIREHESPGDLHGSCGGRDAVLDSCTCPDLIFRVSIRISTGTTFGHVFECACCGLPLDPWNLPSSRAPKP